MRSNIHFDNALKALTPSQQNQPVIHISLLDNSVITRKPSQKSSRPTSRRSKATNLIQAQSFEDSQTADNSAVQQSLKRLQKGLTYSKGSKQQPRSRPKKLISRIEKDKENSGASEMKELRGVQLHKLRDASREFYELYVKMDRLNYKLNECKKSKVQDTQEQVKRITKKEHQLVELKNEVEKMKDSLNQQARYNNSSLISRINNIPIIFQ